MYGNNGVFLDVNGIVIFGRVVLRSVKIEFYFILDRILERVFVVGEIILLVFIGEVDCMICLIYKSVKNVVFNVSYKKVESFFVFLLFYVVCSSNV